MKRTPDYETGGYWTENGWVPYEWLERYSIVRESGGTHEEAVKTANEQVHREAAERIGHGGR